MKKSTLLLAAFAAFAAISCDRTEEQPPVLQTITFEGSEWTSLVPSSQVYGAEELYGDTQYVWSDSETSLSGGVNTDSWGTYAYAFYSGGSVVSNYTDVIDGAYSDMQLAVPIGGCNGSDNFLVTYSPATLSFDEAKRIESLYLANTSYMLNVCMNGDGYSVVGGLSDEDWVTVTITGYDSTGAKSGSVVTYMAKDGVEVLEWTKVDLSTLGEVSKIEFACDSSNVGDWGNNIPQYVAVDDITVVLE